MSKKQLPLPKPPLGIEPHFVYEEDRILTMMAKDKARLQEINDAKKRYREAKIKPPADWSTQARAVSRRIRTLRKKWATNRQSASRMTPRKD